MFRSCCWKICWCVSFHCCLETGGEHFLIKFKTLVVWERYTTSILILLIKRSWIRLEITSFKKFNTTFLYDFSPDLSYAWQEMAINSLVSCNFSCNNSMWSLYRLLLTQKRDLARSKTVVTQVGSIEFSKKKYSND